MKGYFSTSLSALCRQETCSWSYRGGTPSVVVLSMAQDRSGRDVGILFQVRVFLYFCHQDCHLITWSLRKRNVQGLPLLVGSTCITLLRSRFQVQRAKDNRWLKETSEDSP